MLLQSFVFWAFVYLIAAIFQNGNDDGEISKAGSNGNDTY